MREIKFRAWILEPIDDEPRMVYNDDDILPGYHCGVFGDFKCNGRDRIYMQYTGLKDKNGKEIYEGDILKHPYKGVREIVWEDSEAAFIVDGTYPNRMAKHGEIIGNIYENPKLLNNKGE